MKWLVITDSTREEGKVEKGYYVLLISDCHESKVNNGPSPLSARKKLILAPNRSSAGCYAPARGKQSATNHREQNWKSLKNILWLLQIITMSTLFEPSLSTSAMRAPLSTADAPSMADTLPAIAFGFDDLRERMARFTDRFDEFIAKGRKQVLEERNKFRINVAELQGKHSLH